MAPCEFKNDVGVKKVVTLIEASSKAIKIALFKEPSQQFFGDLGILRFCCILHSILKETIFLTQLNRLLPAVISLVQIRSDSAELY